MAKRRPAWMRLPRKTQVTLNRFLMESRPVVEMGDADGTHLWELVPEHITVLRNLLAQVEGALNDITHLPVWTVQYSGGKDSTGVLALAVEYLLRHPELIGRVKLLITHNDTLMDAAPLEMLARQVMDYAQGRLRAAGFACEVRITMPPIEDDFWTMTLGYGYPLFSNRFRPCTDRLKIQPSTKEMKQVALEHGANPDRPGEVMALLLGVRVDESESRRVGLTSMCNLTDGECGQILDAPQHLPGVTTVAPVINARTCNIWDLAQFILPELGWPTAELARIYGDEVVRFGCWMCPLVSRAWDVENLAQTEEWAWMTHLLTFRHDYLDAAKRDENRIWDERGKKRGLVVAFRKRWFAKLQSLKRQVPVQIIRPEVEEYIQHLWHIEETTGARGKSGRATTERV